MSGEFVLNQMHKSNFLSQSINLSIYLSTLQNIYTHKLQHIKKRCWLYGSHSQQPSTTRTGKAILLTYCSFKLHIYLHQPPHNLTTRQTDTLEFRRMPSANKNKCMSKVAQEETREKSVNVMIGEL